MILSDEKIQSIYEEGIDTPMDFARAIEAAAFEKLKARMDVEVLDRDDVKRVFEKLENEEKIRLEVKVALKQLDGQIEERIQKRLHELGWVKLGPEDRVINLTRIYPLVEEVFVYRQDCPAYTAALVRLRKELGV